jgi:YHS domain-containing protein
MIRRVAIALVAFAGLTAFAESSPPAPEKCLVERGGKAAASATYNGKTYEFSAIECREEFVSDPERYSQLYDALAELAATGVAVRPEPLDASLVPS